MDLVSSVDVTAHSNIPTRDFTTRSETKEESKQTDGAAVPKTAQPAKRSASSSSRVKASDEESPTIVTAIITTRQSGSSVMEDAQTTTTRSDRAGQESHSNPDKATSSVDESAKESKLNSPEQVEASTKMEDLEMGKEMLKATRDPAFSQGPEGTDQAGNSIHSVQVESAVLDGPTGICTSRLAGEPYPDTVPPTSSRDPAGYRAADEKEEAASAQAVKRGASGTGWRDSRWRRWYKFLIEPEN